MTLIEVIAGLALLASLLVGVLLAKARHTRQLALSQRRLAAIAAADHLMATWWTSPAGVPKSAQGAIEGIPGLTWRTSPVPNDAAGQFDASVVRLEVVDAQTSTSPLAVLAAIEVVVANPPVQLGPAKGGQWQ